MKQNSIQLWHKTEYTYKSAYGFIPKILSYLHEDDESRPCILIIPGGAYAFVSAEEGENIALKFYELGYQAFVLSYTTNPFKLEALKLQPLKDVSRAIRFIRKNADAFHVKMDKLIVCGFSAGGHLAGSICVHHQDIVDTLSEYRDVSNRPDAAILCYPVITSGEMAHQESIENLLGEASAEELQYMSLEKQVSADMPPCFLWATATDNVVPVQNSLLFAAACIEKNIPCALHIFSHGMHGLSLADDDWVAGQHQNPSVMEQFLIMMEKREKGEIVLSKEMEAMLAHWTEPAPEAKQAHPEVTPWPELADRFLRLHL